MNFDVKDVKSWANIRELKVGDKGYFLIVLALLET